MRASDLYRGLTRLTKTTESAAINSVGMMIQPRLRTNAEPRARKSRSPDVTAVPAILGAALGSCRGTAASLSMAARQNAKRIAHSEDATSSTERVITLN